MSDDSQIKKLILEVLEGGYLMSLGTSDKGGAWVSDVIYVYDKDMNIYWLSDEDTRHSKAILENPVVGATITISNGKGEPNVGIQISGIAEKIEGDVFEMGVAHRVKRGKPIPLESILDEGESWYKITPKLIELIYEPLFGFDKQGLELG